MKHLFLVIILTINFSLYGTTYYISPDGSDANPGTINQPFYTLNKAWTVISPGDVIYMRGGTYYYKSRTNLANKSGSSGNMINIWNYPGESPIINCRDFASYSVNDCIYLNNVDYVYLKGIRITNMPQQNSDYGRYGIILWNDVNNCKFEKMEIDHIGGWGLTIGDNSQNNLFLYCDSHHNEDPKSGYGNADGFQSQSASSTNNTFRGCRSWWNSDDGFDFRQSDGLIIIDNCWAFWNGYVPGTSTSAGNGEGFKIGSKREPATTNTLRIVTNCVSFQNKSMGFGLLSLETTALRALVYNCTSYNNGSGGFQANAYTIAVLRNNLSYANAGDYINSYADAQYNSWNGFSVSNTDFLTLDSGGVDEERQSDGSFPVTNFLKLAKSSKLIDAGVDVGLPYGGNAPDLGAFETDIDTYIPPIPQYQSSVIENSSPSILEITFSLTLANIVPNPSAFSVVVNSTSRSVNSVAISGSEVLLNLATPVDYDDVVTIAYTVQPTNPLQTSAGGIAEAISVQTVTNNVDPPSPVYVSSAIENATPSLLEMTYNLSLANSVPAASAFAVRVNSVARTVNSVAISGAKVLLTLASPLVYGDVVTVAYTKPSTNPIKTPAGGEAASLSAQTVTNKVAPPIPVYVSSAIENATPSRLEMTYNLNLANIVPATSAFTVQVNSVTRTVNSVAISGTKVLLTLTSLVLYGNVVTVAYTKPSTNPLQTSAGVQAATISAQTVTNKIASPIPVYVSSAIENATPAVLEITYNLSLANSVPAASAFTVNVNSVARSVTAVAISGTKVILTLSSAVVYGNIVTVAYTKPAANPIKTAAGGEAASLSAQSVTNKVSLVNTPPVVIVNYTPSNLSGFVGEINASGSYDANNDNLSYEWVAPGNVSISSTNGSMIKFLSPIVDAPKTVEFTLKISDGKATQIKVIPVEIIPYKPKLEVAEVSGVEASSFLYPNFPFNVLDGNIGTMWAANGDNQWIVLQFKESFKIDHIKLAFQLGQRKESYFDILCSADNVTWEPVLTKSRSCGFSGNLQVFEFPATKTGSEYSYIKLVGHCNSTDTWNYISEFKIFGYFQRNLINTEQNPIIIYPNPAKEYINISIKEPTLIPDFIRIINLSGKVVYEDKIKPDIKELQIPNSFINGVYIIQLGSDDLTLFTQKLIVSN